MSTPKLFKAYGTDISHMSMLEMFNLVYKGLEAQNWVPSSGKDAQEGYQCYYLSDNGAKCAAGHLLREETLQRIKFLKLNTYPITNLILEKLLVVHSRDQENFVRDLQSAHDKVYSSNPEKDKDLRKVAFHEIAWKNMWMLSPETKEWVKV